MYSDEKYIESIRKNYAKRKIHAVILVVISFGLSLYVYSLTEYPSKLNSTILDIDYLFIEGEKITMQEIKSVKSHLELSEILYTYYGMVMGAFALIVLNTLGYAIYLVFGSRKERLLIKLYENKKA